MTRITKRIVSFLFITALFFASCETDPIEIDAKNDTNSIQLSNKFRNDFDTKKFAKSLRYKYQVDWSNPIKQYSEQLQSYYYEFPIIYSDAFNPDEFNKQIKRDLYEKYKIVVTDNGEGKYDYFIAKYFLKNIEGNTAIENDKLSLNVNKGYNGTLHLYNKDADMIFAKHVNSNKATSKFYSKNDENKGNTQARWEEVCKTTTIYHYTDWFRVVYDGYGNIISVTFLYTTFNGTSQTKVCHNEWRPDPVTPNGPIYKNDEYEIKIACPLGYRDDGFGDCEKIPTINAHADFDDQIFNELTGRALCIYNKLNVSSNQFKNAIKKFDGEFPVSHLKLTVNNDLPSGNYGVTIPPDNFITTIELSNTQLANISDLGSAISIAHEIIHAEIFRKLLSAAKKGDLNTNNYTTEENINFVNSLRNNFSGLYDYYYERVHKNWNHDLIAQHYRSVIADIAQEYDNNTFPRQIYEDLAWAGLREIEKNINSIAWNNLTTTEQERIKLNLVNLFHNGEKNCK